MKIYFNDELITLPSEYMTVENLAEWKNIPQEGSAIAVNNKLIRKQNWSTVNLSDNDMVTVISAAFGG